MTQQEIAEAIKSWLPSGWAASDTPNIDAINGAAALGLAYNYAQLDYAQAQSRVQTATGENLDNIAWDFFGQSVTRFPGESDGAWRLRLWANLRIDSQTKECIEGAILQLTGLIPVIWTAYGDTGLGVNYALGVSPLAGYMPFWYHITVFRYGSPFIQLFGGLGQGLYLGGPGALYDPTMSGEYISDAAITQVLDRFTAAGVTYELDIIDL